MSVLQTALIEAERRIEDCQRFLAERLVELEAIRSPGDQPFPHRLYDQALACRMRPFADGLAAFPRMVR